jgi:hypothetical protein
MQSKLKSRLDTLEKATRKPPASPVFGQEYVGADGVRPVALGVERAPNESLAETPARAMGISIRELRAKLWLLAGGS